MYVIVNGAAEWTRTTMMLPSLAPEASASAISPQPHAVSMSVRISNPHNPVLDQCGAEDRNRTGTIVTNPGILSPVRLPVSPPRPVLFSMERVMGIGPT